MENEKHLEDSNEYKMADLEKAIADLQGKVAKIESSKAWYRNYPFLLSLIAFFFTSSISLYTLRKSNEEKAKTSYSSTISSIISQIDNIKTYEKDYFQQLSSIAIDNNTKTALTGIYFSKLDQLTNDISKKMAGNSYNDLEPSVLNDYARYEQLIGNTANAIRINHIALAKCTEKDRYTKVTIMRTLGNLYSVPSDSQNLDKSRFHRNTALSITKTYLGEYSTFNIMQSFVLWANDEYVNFNNKSYANALLDSALSYAERLQEYNPQKYESIKQIRSAYNYYNDVLNINFGSGSWIISQHKSKIGVANISSVNNSYSVSIDINRNGKLEKQITGMGNFTSERKMKFVGTVSYLEKISGVQYKKNPVTNQIQSELGIQLIPQQRIITLELDIKKNKQIEAKYYELERPADRWDLQFIRNF